MINGNHLPDSEMVLTFDEYPVIYKDFLETVDRMPDFTALSSSYGECRYSELANVSREIANYLVCNSVRKNDCVVIISDRNPGIIYALLGVLRAGAVFNIADSAYPISRILLTIKMLQPRLILACGDVDLPEESYLFYKRP